MQECAYTTKKGQTYTILYDPDKKIATVLKTPLLPSGIPMAGQPKFELEDVGSIQEVKGKLEGM